MNKLVQKLALSAVLAVPAAIANAQQVYPLDSAFGNNGIAYLNNIYTGHHMSNPVDITLQSDGKFLCCYNDMCHTFLLRQNADGTLDNTFTAGSLSFEVFPNDVPGVMQFTGSVTSSGQTLIKQTASGKIVFGLFGHAIFGIKANGSVDSTFGNVVNVPGGLNLNQNGPSTEINYLYDIHESQAALYFAGTSGQLQTNSVDTLLIAKTTLGGDLVNAYGTNGILEIPLDTTKFGWNNTIKSVIFTNDDKVVFVGTCYRSTHPGNFMDIFVARYKMDGTPDNTFGTNGVRVIDVNNRQQEATAATISPNGTIFVTGLDRNQLMSDEQIFTVKVFANGNQDMSYGTNGSVLHTTPGTVVTRYPASLAATGGDKLFMVNMYTVAFQDWRDEYVSYNEDGTPNTQFATNGIINNNTYDRVFKLLRQSDEKILAIGADTHARILRFKGDPDALSVTNIQSTAAKAWAADGKAFVQVQGSTEISAALMTIDGKTIRRYTNADFTTQAKDIKSVSLPSDLSHGTYIMSVQNKVGTQSIKFTY